MRGVEYRGIASVDGPIVIVRRRENTSFGEIVRVRDGSGSVRTGRVIDVSDE